VLPSSEQQSQRDQISDVGDPTRQPGGAEPHGFRGPARPFNDSARPFAARSARLPLHADAACGRATWRRGEPPAAGRRACIGHCAAEIRL